jgi:hypothetical protein
MTAENDAVDGVVVDRSVSEPDSSQPTRSFAPADRIALVDLLDRVLAGGVVAAGEVTLSIADVDMVTVSLRALVTSASSLYNPHEELRRIAE